jgi:hypothetical protein
MMFRGATAAVVMATALVVVSQARPAARTSAAANATVRVTVAYAPTSAVWRGTFVSVAPTGKVVDRGTVVDGPRQRLGKDWSIRRSLKSKLGTLRFTIVGRYQVPRATLKWTILGGTGAYSGLSGTGTDIERVAAGHAAARMLDVPAP